MVLLIKASDTVLLKLLTPLNQRLENSFAVLDLDNMFCSAAISIASQPQVSFISKGTQYTFTWWLPMGFLTALPSHSLFRLDLTCIQLSPGAQVYHDVDGVLLWGHSFDTLTQEIQIHSARLCRLKFLKNCGVLHPWHCQEIPNDTISAHNIKRSPRSLGHFWVQEAKYSSFENVT